jgi:hypothetical protein
VLTVSLLFCGVLFAALIVELEVFLAVSAAIVSIGGDGIVVIVSAADKLSALLYDLFSVSFLQLNTKKPAIRLNDMIIFIIFILWYVGFYVK